MQPVPVRISPAAERAWVLLGFLLVSVAFSATQPVAPDEAQGYGGQAYHAMAKAMPRELPPQGVAPYVYRWGTPLVAAGLAKSMDWVVAAGFDRLNIAFNALSVLLLTLLLQRHVPSLLARLLVLAAFMIEPHSPVRLSYVHPVSVDPSAMAGLLAGLVGIDWFHARPEPRRAALLAVLVSAGVIFHEAILIIGVCVLFMPAVEGRAAGWRGRFASLDRTGAWLPLVAGIAALAAVHAWIEPVPSSYSTLGDALRWLTGKSPVGYALAWFLVFGPLLVVPAYYWRTSVALLRQKPALLAYLAILALVAWVGDGQTERLLALASPVVYVLIARALPIEAMPAAFTGALVTMQALSSRALVSIGGPITPPEVGTEIWERLVSPNVAWALSYQNMWSQFCAPAMTWFYLAWFSLTGCVVWALARQHSSHNRRPAVVMPRDSERASWTRLGKLALARPPRWLWTAAGTTVAMAPVVWLATSRFYWHQFAQPGLGYLGYNLARLWMLAVILAAFWATGSRILNRFAPEDESSGASAGRWIEAVFCGAAAWSIAVVVLAAVGGYYLWVLLPLVATAVALAMSDRQRFSEVMAGGNEEPGANRWGIVGLVLRLGVGATATVILLSIALWGHFGGDNDVPGNYLPYYGSVLRDHSNGPNEYWVHFFASKGHGLGFLANMLSDVQGAGLVTYLMVLLGAAMMWRLGGRSVRVASAIGLAGSCLFLQHYAGQGAYAKPHVVRSIFILFVILSTARRLCYPERNPGIGVATRPIIITAIIVSSPLAVVILVPILLVEAAFLAWSRSPPGPRRTLLDAGWALVATVAVCTYNFFSVGLPELHAMPSALARFMDLGRLGRWVDPNLAYVDYHLAFLQGALPPGSAGNPDVMVTRTQSLLQASAGMLGPSAWALLAGGMVATLVGWFVTRSWPAAGGRDGGFTSSLSALYLVVVLALLAVLQMFGGGPGSSMSRFTDFASPVAIALGVTLLTAAWSVPAGRVARTVLGATITATAVLAIYLGSAPVLALPLRSGAEFLLGRQTYASMNEPGWDTGVAHLVAQSLPVNARAELLNFLPGFTAIPSTPFQRPDGCVYIKDYTKVLYGSEDQAARIYQAAHIDYFLFDLSKDSPVVWSGFSRLFAPESLRTRMQLVAHEVTNTRDLYLLTWRRDSEPTNVAALEPFLLKWADKVAREKQQGYFGWAYRAGAERLRSQ